MPPLLQARGLTKAFASTSSRNPKVAIEDFSLTIEGDPPSITAVVGESGSGKTTVARLFLGLIAPTSGDVLYMGKSLRRLSSAEQEQYRRDVQIIFQDPFEVYNPFYKVDHLLTVAIDKFKLAASKQDRTRLMETVLTTMGLEPSETLGRYPHQLSGGQRQRVAIARALLIRPRLIIADEPVSMVDASLRASILGNLQQLKREFGISVLYITHDLATAFQLSDNMIVLYHGSVVEAGDVEQIVLDPKHPYTQQLINSIPQPDPDKPWGGQDTPNPALSISEPSHGCKFADRCPFVMSACLPERPPLLRIEQYRVAACILYSGAEVVPREQMDTVFAPPKSEAVSVREHQQGGYDGTAS
jgi:peptide/nickel transport system ATP-binding protein